METMTAVSDRFTTIREQQFLIDRLNHWKFNDATPDSRVKAAEDLKVAKRKLYRLMDELTPDEIREYGKWVGVPTD